MGWGLWSKCLHYTPQKYTHKNDAPVEDKRHFRRRSPAARMSGSLMNMPAFEIILLSLSTIVIAALVTGVEWMPRYFKRRAINRKLGVSHEPELRGELLKVFAIVWLCRVVHLGLIAFVVTTKPTGITWIPIAIAFILSLAAYFAADKTRRSLLA